MVGTINADHKFGTSSPDTGYFGGTFVADSLDIEDNQYIFVQLRPGLERVRKCLLALKDITSRGQHEAVPYSLIGVANESHQCALTLSVDFGPREEIASHGEQAIAAFRFISALFDEMFEFLPQYTAVPDAAARATASALVESMTEPVIPAHLHLHALSEDLIAV